MQCDRVGVATNPEVLYINEMKRLLCEMKETTEDMEAVTMDTYIMWPSLNYSV